MSIGKNKANQSKLGLKISTDLLASCIVGTVLGVYLDNFFKTKPIFLIICLFLSLMSALYNIYKYMNNHGK